MAPHKTVTINGRKYDAVTGLPIESVEVVAPDRTPIKKKPATSIGSAKPITRTSAGIHSAGTTHASAQQRAQTLRGRTAKKPAAPQKPVITRNKPGKQMDIARSTRVARFAQHPVAATSPSAKPAQLPAAKPTAKPALQPAPRPVAKPAVPHDAAPQVHPLAAKALRKTASKPAVVSTPATAKEVKDAAISKALAAPKPKAKQPKKDTKKMRRLIIAAIVIAVLTIAAIIVWRLVPTISVSIAAAQAGIEATYPEYTPDGYSLSQPVEYGDGRVDLKFKSNSNDNYYLISQTRSLWDSSAVLDKVVTPEAGANYVTTKERGLVIYTYETNAAWVNRGILYKIESKAPLSGDQIRRIATSL